MCIGYTPGKKKKKNLSQCICALDLFQIEFEVRETVGRRSNLKKKLVNPKILYI